MMSNSVAYGVMLVVALGMCFAVANMYSEEERVETLFFEACALFTIGYLLVSIPLLFLGKFQAGLAMIGVVLVCFAVLVYGRINKYFFSRIKFGKSFVFIIIIFLLSINLIKTTSEDVTDTSDQGTYFKYTLLLANEQDSNYYKIEEFDNISPTVNVGLKELQDELIIYYQDEETEEDNCYYLHALKTWCIFPALCVKMFGVWKSLYASNFFYFISVGIFFEICMRLTKNLYAVIGTTLVYAFSPIVLYIGKAGLSESLFGFLILYGIYNVLKGQDNVANGILAGVTIGLCGFVHISFVMWLPIVFAILTVASTKKRIMGYINIVQLIFFGLSLWYIYTISPIYTKRQYASLMVGGMRILILFILIDAFIMILVLAQWGILCYKDSRMIIAVKKWLLTNSKILYAILIVIIYIGIKCRAYNLAYTDNYRIIEDAGSWNLRMNYINTGRTALSHLNIVNIARAVGIVPLVCVLLYPFIKKCISIKTIYLYGIILYALLLHCVYNIDTPFNYYGSRYFYPIIIPFTLLTFASLKINNKIVCMVSICSLFWFAQFWQAFIGGAPSYGKYDVAESIINEIPCESVVLINDESATINTNITSCLRLINKNAVYNYKNVDEITEYYKEDSIYILSSTPIGNQYELVFSNVFICQYSFGNGENGTYAKNFGAIY